MIFPRFSSAAFTAAGAASTAVCSSTSNSHLSIIELGRHGATSQPGFPERTT
jgi:hypothetical protein